MKWIALLMLLCSGISLAAQDAADDVTAADDAVDTALSVLLKGRWEGAIVGSLRKQDVSWRFETDGAGKLLGFMGQRDAGMANVAMNDLRVTGDHLHFSINAQHATYEGTLRDGVISGSWQQGTVFPLQMQKRIFAFALPATVHQALLGRWETAISGRSRVLVEFSDQGNGALTGTMEMSPANRLPVLPLLDVYAKEDGYVSFSADTKRSFSGRIVGRVMYGDYKVDKSQYTRVFTRPDHGEELYDLGLSEQQFDKLKGTWQREGRISTVVYHFFRTEDGKTGGELRMGLGIVATPDRIVLVEVQGDHVVIVSAGGRFFSGDFIDEGITGQYQSGRRPTDIKLVKVPDQAAAAAD